MCFTQKTAIQTQYLESHRDDLKSQAREELGCFLGSLLAPFVSDLLHVNKKIGVHKWCLQMFSLAWWLHGG